MVEIGSLLEEEWAMHYVTGGSVRPTPKDDPSPFCGRALTDLEAVKWQYLMCVDYFSRKGRQCVGDWNGL